MSYDFTERNEATEWKAKIILLFIVCAIGASDQRLWFFNPSTTSKKKHLCKYYDDVH